MSENGRKALLQVNQEDRIKPEHLIYRKSATFLFDIK